MLTSHAAEGGPAPARAEESRSSPGLARSVTRVLVADDEPALRRTLARLLTTRGLSVEQAADGAAALELLTSQRFDVALVDLRMPRVEGFEILRQIKARQLAVEVVMMTAFADVETAVKAVQGGAYQFLTKPFRSNDEVVLAVAKAAERRRLLDRTEQLERALDDRQRLGGLIGNSASMREVYRLAVGVASTSSTVLILGESGTGKELTARAIHQHSARAKRAFVAVNCSAIPENLVESELFGHVKGAFTGATATRQGLFEAAHQGTLFLDEVGDLPAHAQVKLLRALQEGEIKPVGSTDTRAVDVRVVAATNVDLKSLIEAGKFREDLFYRLNVIAIELPPLREREDDVAVLAQHFLHKFAARLGRSVHRFSPEALELLLAHPWPGNVRELENAIEHAVVFCTEDTITPASLPFGRAVVERVERSSSLSVVPSPQSGGISPAVLALPYREAKQRALLEFEREYFEALLARTGGNVTQAAREAGLDRSNFRRVMRRVGADRPHESDD